MTKRVDFFIPGHKVSGKPFHYAACGLDYVYLLNGVTRENDPDYGEILTIQDEDDLLKAIGLHIAQKRGMTSKEFKFLRKLMGRTQEELAWELEVTEQTVANYEKKGRIPGASQKLMRLNFLLFVVPPDTKAKVLSDLIAEEAKRSKKPAMGRERGKIVPHWHQRGELAVVNG